MSEQIDTLRHRVIAAQARYRLAISEWNLSNDGDDLDACVSADMLVNQRLEELTAARIRLVQELQTTIDSGKARA